MKLWKKAAVLALGGLMALSAAACGGTAPEDAQASIQAALEKLNAAESMDASMAMEMDMTAMGQSVESDTVMDMTCFSNPLKLRADMTMDMGDLGSLDMEVYAQETDGEYTVYLSDGASWMASAIDLGELGQYDAQQSMNLSLESGADYAYQGAETVNGAAAHKFTGVIRGEALEEVLESSGASSSLTSSLGGLSSVDLSQIYGDLGDLPVTVWVDQESGYPVRYYMDMTGPMQALMDNILSALAGSLGEEDAAVDLFTVDKVTITMDCSNFNSAADFEIPAEALAAS